MTPASRPRALVLRLIPGLSAGLVALVAATGIAGCRDGDTLPVLPGDLPPADAGSTDAGPIWTDDGGHEGPCGVAVFPPNTGLRRFPYLQSVGTTIARVMWTTTTAGLGYVRIWPRAGGRAVDVRAAYESFPIIRTNDSVDYGAYVATIRRLNPDTDYCYQVYEGKTLLGAGLSLHTAWRTGSWGGVKKPVRILAFGDSGSGSAPQYMLRDLMLMRGYDLFLHLGDIAYSSGSFDQFERYFFEVYRDLLHHVPVYPVIGNHEYYTERAQPYIDVFHLPQMAWRREDDERYYSFDLGGVHFVALDSNFEMLVTVDDVATDDMVDWLRDDLERSEAPWKIALFHHPVWSGGAHGSTLQVQEKIMGALEEGGIDLVLNGHDHHYERTVPIWQSVPAVMGDQRAITYLVAGGGGASLYPVVPDWFTQIAASQYSFLDLTIDGCTGTGKAIAVDGTELDAFVVDGCDK